jgi:putative Holliday junction resolvase
MEILDKVVWMGDKKLMRIMGLDIGSRTIGVAISDELDITAQGLKTIRRKSFGRHRELTRIIQQFDVKKVVVGLPKNMDGTIGIQAERIFRWIKSFQEKMAIPVVTWDERLSTVGASRILLEADLSRKKRKGVIDKIAAVLILQGYMDQARNRRDEPFPPA